MRSNELQARTRAADRSDLSRLVPCLVSRGTPCADQPRATKKYEHPSSEEAVNEILREGRVALVGQNCFIVGGMRDGNRGHWQLEVRRHQRHGLEGRLPALVEVTGLEVIGSERGWHGWLGFLGTNDPGSTRSSPTGHHGTGGSSAVGRVAPPDVD